MGFLVGASGGSGASVAGVVGAVVFFGGMVKDEMVSSRRVEVSVQIYCYAVIIGG